MSPAGSPLRPDPPAEPASNEGPSSRPADQAIARFRIFEQVALERLQAGSDLTQPVSFLPLPVRLTALVATGIVGAGVAWAFTARVPIQVNGTAAIVPESALNSLSAPVGGTVFLQVSGLGSARLPEPQRQANALLGAYWSREAVSLTHSTVDAGRLRQLVAAALKPLRGVSLVLPESPESRYVYDRPGADRPATLFFPAGTVLAAIEDPSSHLKLNSALLTALPSDRLQRDSAAESRRRSLQLAAMGGLQRRQQQKIEAELRDRLELLRRYESLNQEGALTRINLLEERSRINALRAQLLASQRDELTTRIDSRQQLDGSRKAVIASDETRNALEDQLIAYLTATRVIAPESGAYLLTSNVSNGLRIRRGDEVFSYTTQPPSLPRNVPVFLSGSSAQQVDEGMRVLLTPRGISRAQYGGIPGVVTEVVRLPLASDGVVGVVGSRSLGQAIQAAMPSAYLVRVTLEQADRAYCAQLLSRRCYRWSSGRLPPPIRCGWPPSPTCRSPPPTSGRWSS